MTLRSQILRIAAGLPEGDATRRELLAALRGPLYDLVRQMVDEGLLTQKAIQVAEDISNDIGNTAWDAIDLASNIQKFEVDFEDGDDDVFDVKAEANLSSGTIPLEKGIADWMKRSNLGKDVRTVTNRITSDRGAFKQLAAEMDKNAKDWWTDPWEFDHSGKFATAFEDLAVKWALKNNTSRYLDVSASQRDEDRYTYGESKVTLTPRGVKLDLKVTTQAQVFFERAD